MNNRLYVDVHILQTVPPANVNRDDNGQPKEAYFGGTRRSRVSSQAWKRATRTAFADQLPEELRGTRTKKVAAELAARIQLRTGLDAEPATRLATALLQPLGIKPGKKAGDLAYLLFVGYRQLDALVELVAERAAELADADDKALAEAVDAKTVFALLGQGHPMDVALFGRMVADRADLNVDAAVQVAHALSTHAVEQEFDYYTAVDDEATGEETGASMIGTVGFNAATLYRYAAVNLPQLVVNLGETDAAVDAVEHFVRHFARSIPSGKQNSFAHRTLPSLVAVTVREDQPVNLVSAFEKPVASNAGLAEQSAIRLATEYVRSVKQWGDTPSFTAVSHAFGNKELTEAFGAPMAFPVLLQELRAQLAEFGKRTG